jgi:preprotein translocase subunit YajC
MANTPFVVFAQDADGSVSATSAVSPVETTATTVQAGEAAPENGQQQAPPPSANMMMVPLIIVIAVMIAISIRTSSKEKKKREEMMNSIRKGTKIMTSGGIIGEIAEVQKDQFMLKVANNVQIAISRSAVAQVIQPAAGADDKKDEVTKK